MKILLIAACLTFNAFADTKCSLYELSGRINLTKTGTEIIVAEKTGSQRKLAFYYELQNKVAPYVNQYVSGKFILGEKEILGVKTITQTIYDPMNANETTIMKKMKEETCPSF